MSNRRQESLAVCTGDVYAWCGKAQADKQREIFESQLEERERNGDPKLPPKAKWPNVLDGQIAKWFNEVTLLGQDNVWDPPAGSIDKLRQELGKKLGGEVKIHGFIRFSLGEGIEKKQEDLAAEVAKTIGG